ncbi:hypothetical protein [Ktedonospora formicarum]|uniref:Uncharacterized protein n=1 Tax=Ktedonospora formicarum TaxID=2778364 RepID=A0A8J3HWI6_9CHLR|nr:hypothetical protein [Ktedonospora formicarum]GHO41913.1 hypothetical protein KSX_00760 [Ktedonospora formicarum]
MPVAIEEETRLAPRSLVVRHHPVRKTSESGNVQIARASQLTKTRSRSTSATDIPPWQHTASSISHMGARKIRGSWSLWIGVGMLCALFFSMVGQLLVVWGTTLKDDVQYGRPRTTHVDHFVGHERNASLPTHFTAINLQGQVYIFEMPGGDEEHTHLLIGPHLIDSGADLAPVTLTFLGDARHPDLVVNVNGLQVRFRNTGSSYEPIT